MGESRSNIGDDLDPVEKCRTKFCLYSVLFPDSSLLVSDTGTYLFIPGFFPDDFLFSQKIVDIFSPL